MGRCSAIVSGIVTLRLGQVVRLKHSIACVNTVAYYNVMCGQRIYVSNKDGICMSTQHCMSKQHSTCVSTQHCICMSTRTAFHLHVNTALYLHVNTALYQLVNTPAYTKPQKGKQQPECTSGRCATMYM